MHLLPNAPTPWRALLTVPSATTLYPSLSPSSHPLFCQMDSMPQAMKSQSRRRTTTGIDDSDTSGDEKKHGMLKSLGGRSLKSCSDLATTSSIGRTLNWESLPDWMRDNHVRRTDSVGFNMLPDASVPQYIRTGYRKYAPNLV